MPEGSSTGFFSNRPTRLVTICLLVWLAGMLFSQVVVIKPLLRLEYGFEALVCSMAPIPDPHPQLVFLAIDESSLAGDSHWEEESADSRALQIIEDGFPWNREIYALILDKMAAAGARAVVFDLLYDSPREGDDAFAAALEKHGDIAVIGFTFDETQQAQDISGMPRINLPSDTLIDWPEGSDPRIGFVNFWPEPDLRIWAARYNWTLSEAIGRTTYAGEEVFSSLAANALKQAGYGDLVPADTEKHFFRLVGKDAYKPIPVASIFPPDVWESTFKGGEFFRDKIVLVGPSAPRFHDVQVTPVGEMLGPALHLNAIQAAFDDGFYELSSRAVDLSLVFVGAVLALVTVYYVRSPLPSLLLLFGLAAGYVFTAVLLLQFGHYLISGAAPIATMLVSGIFCLGYEYALETIEKTRVRGTLERYVSRNVVREILDNRQDYLSELGGTRKNVTILFSDVRSFTSISESSDPTELVNQLNEYLGAMVDIVFRHDGSVDKFIGDAVMAVWGNVGSEDPETSAKNAVRAALDMRGELATLNVKWAKEGRVPFHIGIGLHHGEVIFGNMGSDKKMEPTVIGDTVNLASRIEGLTKYYRTDIIVSDTVARLAEDSARLRPIDLVKVKGKSQDVEIYDIPEHAQYGRTPDWWDDYHNAIELFRAKRFAEALESLEKCRAEIGGDPTLDLLAQRVRELAEAPPPEDWTPAVTMSSK